MQIQPNSNKLLIFFKIKYGKLNACRTNAEQEQVKRKKKTPLFYELLEDKTLSPDTGLGWLHYKLKKNFFFIIYLNL